MNLSNISAPIDYQTKEIDRSELSEKQKEQLGELEKSANDFEAFFINLLMKQMNPDSLSSDIMGKSRGEKVFEKRLHQNLSKEIASSKEGLGISELVYDSLKQQVVSQVESR